MPTSPFTRTLYAYLSEAGCDSADLRRLGWFEFVNLDAPGTADPREFAAHALAYMLVSPAGREIHHDDRILYGVLAFVESYHRGQPPTSVSRDLSRVLARVPVSAADLLNWFLTTYP